MSQANSAPDETAQKAIDTAPRIDAFAVLDAVEQPVFVVDGRGRIAYRNAAASIEFGDHDTIVDVMPHAASSEFGTALAAVFREASPMTVPLADGDRAASICPVEHIRDDEAPLAAITLTAHAAGVRMPAGAELDRRLTALGKLAARVAHELNNPLDGIIRYVNLALRRESVERDEKAAGFLEQSRTGLMRMMAIIGDLLEYSRTTEGAFDAIGINECIETAIQEHAHTAEKNGVVIAADYRTAEMPGVSGTRLLQVCGNLIRNALDAMPSGGRLTITSGRGDGEVFIKIADTGSGLPDDVNKVFEPFFTTKEPGHGTGLGLAICREFVEELGGSLTAQNSAGGALFTIRLPLSRCVPHSSLTRPAPKGRALPIPEPQELPAASPTATSGGTR